MLCERNETELFKPLFGSFQWGFDILQRGVSTICRLLPDATIFRNKASHHLTAPVYLQTYTCRRVLKFLKRTQQPEVQTRPKIESPQYDNQFHMSSSKQHTHMHTYRHTHLQEENLYSALELSLNGFTILNSAGPSASDYRTAERNISEANFSSFSSRAIFYSLQTNSTGGSELQTSSLWWRLWLQRAASGSHT